MPGHETEVLRWTDDDSSPLILQRAPYGTKDGRSDPASGEGGLAAFWDKVSSSFQEMLPPSRTDTANTDVPRVDGQDVPGDRFEQGSQTAATGARLEPDRQNVPGEQDTSLDSVLASLIEMGFDADKASIVLAAGVLSLEEALTVLADAESTPQGSAEDFERQMRDDEEAFDEDVLDEEELEETGQLGAPPSAPPPAVPSSIRIDPPVVAQPRSPATPAEPRLISFDEPLEEAPPAVVPGSSIWEDPELLPPSAERPDAAATLPPGWQAGFDAEKGIPYWFNNATQQSQWTFPEASAEAVEAPPSGWHACLDQATGLPYWFNTETQCSQWTRPM